MRWFVDVSRVGEDTKLVEKFVLEAKQWQAALQEARKRRGDTGPLSTFSIELLDNGYRAVDPSQQIRYAVHKAPADTPLSGTDGKGDTGAFPAIPAEPKIAERADATDPMAAPTPPSQRSDPTASGPKTDPMAALAPDSAPTTARMNEKPSPASTLPVSNTERMTTSEVASGTASTQPHPNQPESVGPVSTAPPEAQRAPAVVLPPPSVGSGPSIPRPAISDQAPNSAPLTETKPAVRPSSPASNKTQQSVEVQQAPEFLLVKKREEEPNEKVPIRYREYVYAVKPGTDKSAVEVLLWLRFRDVAESIKDYTGRKFIQLAIFDHVSSSKPARPPIATLAWKDWRGEPVVQFTTAPRPQSVPPPPVAQPPRPEAMPPPPPSRPAGSSAPLTTPSQPNHLAPAPLASTPAGPPAELKSTAPAAPAAPSAPPSSPLASAPSAPAPPRPSAPAASAPTASEPVASSPSTGPPAGSIPPSSAPTITVSLAPPSEPAPATAPSSAPPAPSFPAPSVPAAKAETVPAPSMATAATERAGPDPSTTQQSFVIAPEPKVDVPAATQPAVDTPKKKAKRRRAADDLIGELFEKMHELHFSPDMIAGVEFVLGVLNATLPSEAIVVHVYDINTRQFVIVRALGPSPQSVVLHRTPDTDSLFKKGMRAPRCLRTSDAKGEQAYEDGRFSLLGVSPSSALFGAVQLGGRYLGAVELVNPPGGEPFTENEANALDYICEQLAEFLASRPIVLERDVVVGKN